MKEILDLKGKLDKTVGEEICNIICPKRDLIYKPLLDKYKSDLHFEQSRFDYLINLYFDLAQEDEYYDGDDLKQRDIVYKLLLDKHKNAQHFEQSRFDTLFGMYYTIAKNDHLIESMYGIYI